MCTCNTLIGIANDKAYVQLFLSKDLEGNKLGHFKLLHLCENKNSKHPTKNVFTAQTPNV